MLYIAWRLILCGHDIKIKVWENSIFELPRVENCISRLCTTPFTLVSHYWWKKSFHVFGTGLDRLSAKLQIAKDVLWHPSRHILSS